MINFDENLFLYQKLFESNVILDIYQRCKPFNNLLPKYWHQLDLFTYRISDMRMLLGLCFDKKIKKYQFYFLSRKELEADYIKTFPFFEIDIENGTKNGECVKPDFNASIWSMRINALTKNAIKENDYTLNRFMKGFKNNLKF